MTTSNLPTVESRVEKAAGILSIPKDELMKIVKDTLGVDPDEFGVQLLDADTTGEDFIFSSLGGAPDIAEKKVAELKLKAVAAILKGRDPFAKAEPVPPPEPAPRSGMHPVIATSEGEALAGLIQSMRSPEQMKDKELLQAYMDDPDHTLEQELNRRVKGQNFVILLDDSEDGRAKIDLEATLDCLKMTRKMTVPSMLPHPTKPGVIVEVYKITQLNPEDNIVELCPFCDEIMTRGYCPKCEASFAGVGDDERAYVRLASQKDSFNVGAVSDRRALLVDAMKGIDTLKENWPGARIEFREKKMTNDLPKLRKIRELPSVKKADPFGVRSK